MGFLDKLGVSIPKFTPLERPELGRTPSYSVATIGSSSTNSVLQQNMRIMASQPLALINLVGPAQMGARAFLINNGVDVLNYSLIDIMDNAASSGACLAEAENHSPAAKQNHIERNHALLYAQIRKRVQAADTSQTGWAVYIFDVSYYTFRTDTDWVEFFGPVPDFGSDSP